MPVRRRQPLRSGDVTVRTGSRPSPEPRLASMATTAGDPRPPVASGRAPWVGLGAALLLVLAAVVVPQLLGWEVHARSAPDGGVPPLHGLWDAEAARSRHPAGAAARRCSAGGTPSTSPSGFAGGRLLLVVVRRGAGLAARAGARRRPNRDLPGAGDTATSTCVRPATSPTCRPCSRSTSTGSRCSHPDNWPTHVAGHPPGALLFFVGAGPARARWRPRRRAGRAP